LYIIFIDQKNLVLRSYMNIKKGTKYYIFNCRFTIELLSYYIILNK